MPNHDSAGAQARPVWMFMAATAMATTVSTMAATAMVKADATEPAAVTCSCEAPAVTASPVAATAPAPSIDQPSIPRAAEPHEQAEAVQAESFEPDQRAVAPERSVPKADVHGALDRDVIRRIVRAHISEVRHCYDEGLAKDPELAGRVIVDFVIGPEGKVTRSSATADFEGDVPECIAAAVGRWLFPKPADGNDVAVKYPFVLEPG